MAKQQVATTQRAYTLRLRGVDKNDNAWREALWATHLAVNKGAKVFGDWLLTLRGGLDHRLAEEKDAKGNPPTDQQIKDRRILLALSWLSVESSQDKLPHVMATGEESADARRRKLEDALRRILAKRAVPGEEIKQWIDHCMPSLSANIREDAAWVDRSAAFDEAVGKVGTTLTREEVWDILEPFFGGPAVYFAGVSIDESEGDEASEEKAKDLCQKAGGWLSNRFGEGKGADFPKMALVYDAINKWASRNPRTPSIFDLASSLAEFRPPSNDADGVLDLISGPGYKSATRNLIKQYSQQDLSAENLAKMAEAAAVNATESREKTGGKGRRPWSDHILQDVEAAIGFTYLQKDERARHWEYAVILDHAARHVSVAFSWIKRAEARRRQFDVDAQRLGEVPPEIVAALDQFCALRSEGAGALDAYRIRKRALGGWDEIVTAWSKADCDSLEKRIEAARLVQANPDLDKFGDIQLFEALAEDEHTCVWRGGAEALKHYALARDAEARKKHFKVPAYRHPDALRHPVFCDFGNSRWNIAFGVHEKAKAAAKKKRKWPDWFNDARGLQMGLWNGQGVTDTQLKWSCKRLAADMGLGQGGDDKQTPATVSRGDRLGRAAGNAAGKIAIANVFEEDHWNGRLQAPRRDLDALAEHVDKHGWNNDRARSLRERVRWLISFSPKLQPHGPWIDYCGTFADEERVRPFVSGKGEYAVKHEGNDKRKGLGKLGLCRLRDLRVLSVDLGHRWAAACAVWQVVERVDAGIGRVVAGGTDGLFCQVEREGLDGRKHTTAYRRIGEDRLPDGSPHSGSWARLDRQFMLRLQGEGDTRRATKDERKAVEHFERTLGYCRDVDNPLPSAVDDLMDSAVRTCRLGIARHGRRAKIAWALTSTYAIGPGGQQKPFEQGCKEHQEQLLRALVDWHGLATDDRWRDQGMLMLWNSHLLPHGAPPLHGPAETQSDQPLSKQEHRLQQEALQKMLEPIADTLSSVSRVAMADAIAARWSDEERCWPGRLKWLRHWLLPRGLKTDKTKAALARRVGGLSLTRIATFKSLYQVQKAYHMRPMPANPRQNIPPKGDERLEGFGKRMLETMERLRDQRVKQLASRIAEAALGIGKEGGDGKRPTARVFAPCHAVVIENLTNYRPDELQTRRENRQLMEWSSAKVRKYLGEACQLHGLHLREISPAYTSRQSSRTGLPGIRCQDVPTPDFLTPGWHVKAAMHSLLSLLSERERKAIQAMPIEERVARALALAGEGKGEAKHRYVLCLFEQLQGVQSLPQSLLLPVRGGDLFVGSDGRVIQADLNAAANIGLRAIMDPDFAGRWWYVPCDAKTMRAETKEKLKGCPLFTGKETLAKAPENKAKGEIVNLWRDPSLVEPEKDSSWKEFRSYWNGVEAAVVGKLQAVNEKRMLRPEQVKTPW